MCFSYTSNDITTAHSTLFSLSRSTQHAFQPDVTTKKKEPKASENITQLNMCWHILAFTSLRADTMKPQVICLYSVERKKKSHSWSPFIFYSSMLTNEHKRPLFVSLFGVFPVLLKLWWFCLRVSADSCTHTDWAVCHSVQTFVFALYFSFCSTEPEDCAQREAVTHTHTWLHVVPLCVCVWALWTCAVQILAFKNPS